MSVKITIGGNKEIDLATFIIEKLTKTDGKEFRNVDSVISYTANIMENFSRLMEVLTEKKLLGEDDLKRILDDRDFTIKIN